jgi:anti-sigma regulatory factor (Ser/Thr protein kinase)
MAEDPEIVSTTRESIAGPGDDVLARKAAESAAAAAGFADQAVAEIGLVAAELATNVKRHAETGELTVSEIRSGDRVGVRIESLDAGPGIEDVAAAFADGASTGGSLGGGLGTVNRLMDAVTIDAPGEPDYGTHVVADRWDKSGRPSPTELPLSVGAASRPIAPQEPNGDSFVLKRWDGGLLVGVIDGLGHGEGAHRAAMAAKEYVGSHYDRPIPSIFEGTERACRGTRGVVMALARFDAAAETVTIGSVGNIAIKSESAADLSVVPRRGVLGNGGPDPVLTEGAWDPSGLLVMFSDGVVSHWGLADHVGLFEEPATVIARKLLEEYGKDHDDGTVLVVKSTAADQ